MLSISHDFQLNISLNRCSSYPIANTLSGGTRVISSVILLACSIISFLGNTLIGIGQLVAGFKATHLEKASDDLKAVLLNFIGTVYGTFEAIPFIGCIPIRVFMLYHPRESFDEYMNKNQNHCESKVLEVIRKHREICLAQYNNTDWFDEKWSSLV